MPRTMLISTLENPDKALIVETRISAHTIPSTVATTSAHAKTSTVTSAPFASIGRYSARSLRESTASYTTVGNDGDRIDATPLLARRPRENEPEGRSFKERPSGRLASFVGSTPPQPNDTGFPLSRE